MRAERTDGARLSLVEHDGPVFVGAPTEPPEPPEPPERAAESSVAASRRRAPIDLTRGGGCGHCGSPLSMLDMQQAGTLVAQLQSADDRTRQAIDPALPLAMARARREVEQAFANLQRDEAWFREASAAGLVAAGLNAVARWLKK